MICSKDQSLSTQLHEQMNALRNEMRQQMVTKDKELKDIRNEMRQKLATKDEKFDALQNKMNQEINALRKEMQGLGKLNLDQKLSVPCNDGSGKHEMAK